MPMSPRLLALVLTSVSLSAAAQVLLKAGMSSAGVTRALTNANVFGLIVAIATDVRVFLGLATYFASAAVWLFVLARLEVSFAYPFVGLGFILTMLLGWAVFADTISPGRVAGTLLVALGVVLIARS